MTWAKTLGLLLIGIAGVVTPLGLYTGIVAEDISRRDFEYVQDPGPFGYATPGRSPLGFCRRCGSLVPILCPGSTTPYILERNFSVGNITMPQGYDGHIPPERFEFFGSGINRNSNTISGVWDIEWRKYNYRQDKNQDIPMNNGSKYVTGGYQNFDTTVLADEIQLIEGLIVDSKNRGIGFRNHTLPMDAGIGAEWSEDILFTEPETICVPNNITLGFTIADSDTDDQRISNLRITDRGGFYKMGKSIDVLPSLLLIMHRPKISALQQCHRRSIQPRHTPPRIRCCLDEQCHAHVISI